MRQVLQHLGSDGTEIVECPTPVAKQGHMLIDSSVSLISVGTERMLLEFGRANLLGKALQQKDKVAKVLDKVQTDGVLSTLEAVRSKLGQPIPLGYCNVGVVREIGAGVAGFSPGDRVVSNGPHANVVHVPSTLCAKIPDGVPDEEAAFTVMGAIGLQGLRLVEPKLGESVVVIGVGLIGLLTVQLLIAQGVRVLAIDLDESKLDLAAGYGAATCNISRGEDPVACATAFSRGPGVDAVIITASTASSDPIRQAARMSRKRGRIVLVGVTELDLDRTEFYEKELSFQVSCSYGPGRYDELYEGEGRDYPYAFVRWTAQRNFQAVLDMMDAGRVDTSQLISARVPFPRALEAYDRLASDAGVLGLVLDYEDELTDRHASTVHLSERALPAGNVPRVGFIGAGNYASRILIPAFRDGGAELRMISSAGGLSGLIAGRKNAFVAATTDTQALIEDETLNTIAIVTRHDQHADLAIRALNAGKNVYLEKPLALNQSEIDAIERAYEDCDRLLMVGFNRRFSSFGRKMKQLVASVGSPMALVATVNAGRLPPEHWTQNPEIGGGRIVGEACHQIDFMRFLVGAPIIEVSAMGMRGVATNDCATINLRFADGSIGTLQYLANGSTRFPKERIELFVDGMTLQLDNFRRLRGYGWPGFSSLSSWRQDKGQRQCAKAFLDAVGNGAESPIAASELFEVARVAVEASNQISR